MTSPAPLHVRGFGATDLEVTPVCFGTAALGNMPETFAFSVPEAQALETVRAALRSPINFLDTAASYGDGESERRIGVVLREIGGVPPGRVLATKADRNLATGDFSGDAIRRSVDRSLQLLGLERLQLLYLHDPEHATFEAIMAPGGPTDVLLDLKRQGIVAHLGVAGGPIDLSMRYVATGAFDAVITHNRYTLLNRTADPLIDMAAQRGLAVVNAAPYASGLLVQGPDAYPRYVYQPASAEVIERTRRIQTICRRFDVPLAAAALHFSVRDPRITATIVGVTDPQHVAETLRLLQHPVPDELWPQLEPFADRDVDPERDRWKRD